MVDAHRPQAPNPTRAGVGVMSESTEKAANALFDDYVYGLEPQVGSVHEMLDASDRWQDVVEALRASYCRPDPDPRYEKAMRVLRAYEVAMDDVCLRIAESEVEG